MTRKAKRYSKSRRIRNIKAVSAQKVVPWGFTLGYDEVCKKKIASQVTVLLIIQTRTPLRVKEVLLIILSSQKIEIWILLGKPRHTVTGPSEIDGH